MEASDTALVEQSLDGDLEAFSTLVDRYKDLVHSLAYYTSGGAGPAQEITKETFVRAYASLPELSTPFIHGLYQVFSELTQGRPTHRNRSDLVVRALTSLPEELRTVLVLRYGRDASYEEIGAVLAMSEPEVDALLRDAKKRLRSALSAVRRGGGAA